MDPGHAEPRNRGARAGFAVEERCEAMAKGVAFGLTRAILRGSATPREVRILRLPDWGTSSVQDLVARGP